MNVDREISKRRRNGFRGVTFMALIAMGVTLAACGSSSSADSSRTVTAPPAITESFIAGQCTQANQTGLDFCASDRLLANDRVLNSQVKYLFLRVSTAQEREAIVAAQATWLTWRNDNCKVVSDNFAGGSIDPMYTAQCAADADTTESQTLLSLYQTEFPGKTQLASWPTS